jgi:DNA polymerase-3 subunit alpha
LLESDDPIIIQGHLKTTDERGAKIIADRVDTISAAREKYTEKASIVLQAEQISRKRIEGLKKLIQEFYGPCPLSLTIHFDRRGEVDITVPEDLTIRPCSEFSQKVEDLISHTTIAFHKKEIELQPKGNGSQKWQH